MWQSHSVSTCRSISSRLTSRVECAGFRCDTEPHWTQLTSVAIWEPRGRIATAPTNARSTQASIDALAIYCPSPRTFAYLLTNELNASYVNLRFSKAKNGQVKRTRDASEYRDPWRMFALVTGAGEAATSIGTVA